MQSTKFMRAAVGAVLALGFAATSFAQDAWPTRPIKIIVPFPAGGSSEKPIRALAPHLEKILGQSVVVENIGGGGGTLGTARLAQEKPDGYSFVMGAVGTLCIAPHLYSKLGYDPFTSFTPVAQISEYANVLIVNANEPYKTVEDLLDAARKNPGAIDFGSSGNGSSNHLSAELLASKADVKFSHVPYRGTGPALTDLLAGRIPFMFDVVNNPMAWIKEGKVRALGVTSTTRWPSLPDVPPISDTVPDYEVLGWLAMIAPAGLPQPIVDKMGSALKQALETPELAEQYENFGFPAKYADAKALATLIRKDHELWGPVVEASGAKVD